MGNYPTSFTHRSLLNTVGAFLVYLIYIGSSFVSKKYLVVFLGPVAFGAWEVCFRLQNYVSPGEGPVAQALKWILAHKSGKSDKDGLRRYIGSAFLLWAILVFPILLIGVVVAWFSPYFISELPSDLVSVVRLTSFLVVVGLVAGTWARLYLGVLQGLNLLYKGTWAISLFHVLSMALMIAVVYFGFGLKGLALVLILLGCVSGVTYWQMVKAWIPWFGISRPNFGDIKEFFSLGGWMYAWAIVERLLFLSDLVIVGFVQGALAVTSLTFTQYAPHVGVYLAAMLTTAVTPGLGQLIGSNTLGKVRLVREELSTIIWLLFLTGGACVLVWNETLVNLWVGTEMYSGMWVNLLLVLIFGQMAFIRMDAFIIDVSLNVKLKVYWGLGSALLSIQLSFILGQRFGVVGVLGGLLLGRTVLTIAYPLLVGRIIKSKVFKLDKTKIRSGIIGFGILSIAFILGKRIDGVGWFGMLGFGFVTAVLTLVVGFWGGCDRPMRERLWSRALGTDFLSLFSHERR